MRDLDGDHEPEVVLDLFWGGAHCCWWTRVYRLDRARGTYVPLNHWWGDAKARSRLRDLDHDGVPEFVAADDRFTELSYFSADPIQIWDWNAKASAQARFTLASMLSSQLTVGIDYFHSRFESVFASGQKLAEEHQLAQRRDWSLRIPFDMESVMHRVHWNAGKEGGRVARNEG